ncbi:MAG TPA: hypothetical protein VKA38_12505, partial [Draconibacterium sp.]|nr:hypothetical protein [Draconibacterium sp.]
FSIWLINSFVVALLILIQGFLLDFTLLEQFLHKYRRVCIFHASKQSSIRHYYSIFTTKPSI